MKTFLLLIFFALVVAPSAFAQETHGGHSHSDLPSGHGHDSSDLDEQRRAVKLWISHHHEIPDRAQLEDVSPHARQFVFEIARDEEAFLFHRHRALRALANWPDQEVHDFLRELLINPDTEDGLRHHLIPILAHGFGEDSLESLRPFLFDAEDPQIRITTAVAIGHIPGQRALDVLIEALEVEEHPLVRNRIEDYATRIN